MIKNITTKSLLTLLMVASLIVGCNKDDDAALNKCFVTNISYGGTNETREVRLHHLLQTKVLRQPKQQRYSMTPRVIFPKQNLTDIIPHLFIMIKIS